MIQDTTYVSMNYNKITLAFSEVDEHLFLKKYFSDSIFQFRVAFILVIILYGSFGYLDSQVIPAVSYTHLDVYKRQASGCSGSSAAGGTRCR